MSSRDQYQMKRHVSIAQSTLSGISGFDTRSTDVVDRRGKGRAGSLPQGVGVWRDYQFLRFDELDRSLLRRHITSIAFSGTIGIGLFITSGELIGLSGSLGCCLSFLGAGIIVIGVMRSLAELVSVNPCPGALMQYPDDYVDKALGFTVGVIYWLAQCASIGVLTAAAVRVANNFNDAYLLSGSQRGGIITGFCAATLVSNALGVRFYGNLERVVKWIKLITIVALCVLMILVNLRVGLKCPETEYITSLADNGTVTQIERCNWPSRVTNYSQNAVAPFYNPFGFNSTTMSGDTAGGLGIPGAGGRFLAIWTCITLAVFVCMGGDIVIVAAGEAKKPRTDLPAAARFMYVAPLCFYVLTTFLVGLNINYSEADLSRPFTNVAEGYYPSPSPFIIILKWTTLAPNVLPTVLNALFMFSAYTAANTALFTSSRTLFSFSQTYGFNWMKRTLGRTSNGRTPHAAILASATGSLLAFIGMADVSFYQPVLNLSSFFTGAIACVYASECLAYIRFFRGFKFLESEHVPSRDGAVYMARCYRAHWQPLWAYIGLIGSSLIALTSGWPAIYIMAARNRLQSEGPNGATLKSDRRLAWDIVAAYSGVVSFVLIFVVRKYWPGMETRLRTFSEYEKRYTFAEFDTLEDIPDPIRGFRGYAREIWSFIR